MRDRLRKEQMNFAFLFSRHPEATAVGFILSLQEPSLSPDDLEAAKRGTQERFEEDLLFLTAIDEIPEFMPKINEVLQRYREIAEKSIAQSAERERLLNDESIPLAERMENVRKMPKEKPTPIKFPGLYQFTYESVLRGKAIDLLEETSRYRPKEDLRAHFDDSCPALAGKADVYALLPTTHPFPKPRIDVTYRVDASAVKEAKLEKLDAPFIEVLFLDEEEIPVFRYDITQEEYYEDGEWFALYGLLSN